MSGISNILRHCIFILSIFWAFSISAQSIGGSFQYFNKDNSIENGKERNQHPGQSAHTSSRINQKKDTVNLATSNDMDMSSFSNFIQLLSPINTANIHSKLTPATISKISKPQYILYRNLIRRNLWLEGQGEPITQEVADQLPYYFRLSMKNDKGHYQFVEAMHGQDLSDAHTVSPYIMDKIILAPDDTTANGWEARFASVGQWLITSDLSGERVVEERAYEAKRENANLVYAFQPIYNDSTHITGSYTDSWGLAIDINDSGDHYYGSVVSITLNSEGLDSIVDHIDAKGLCRYNQYGADQTRYIYDSKDRLISVTSHNTVGDRIDDNRGICGTIYEYDDADNSCIITHVDKDLDPTRLRNGNPEDRFTRMKIKYDSLGRPSQQEILE